MMDLFRKMRELSKVIVAVEERDELIKRTEEVLKDYETRISNIPENVSFIIGCGGRRFGHLNVKSDLNEGERDVLNTIASNLGFALKSIEDREDKEKLLQKLLENIEVIAYLVDRIRNPLAAIVGFSEFIENEHLKQKIIHQVERVIKIISKLDFAWIESEEIVKNLKDETKNG